jgi:hypothetical protein
VHEALGSAMRAPRGAWGGWSLLTLLLVSTTVLGRTQPPGLCGRASADCRDINQATHETEEMDHAVQPCVYSATGVGCR